MKQKVDRGKTAEEAVTILREKGYFINSAPQPNGLWQVKLNEFAWVIFSTGDVIILRQWAETVEDADVVREKLQRPAVKPLPPEAFGDDRRP